MTLQFIPLSTASGSSEMQFPRRFSSDGTDGANHIVLETSSIEFLAA